MALGQPPFLQYHASVRTDGRIGIFCKAGLAGGAANAIAR
jgi:hypothetical protein